MVPLKLYYAKLTPGKITGAQVRSCPVAGANATIRTAPYASSITVAAIVIIILSFAAAISNRIQRTKGNLCCARFYDTRPLNWHTWNAERTDNKFN